MSFILVNKTIQTETYRIRCDKCSEETAAVEVVRFDTQAKDYQASVKRKAVAELTKLTKDADYRRHGEKHLCQACEAERKPMTQVDLLDKGPLNPQAWRKAG